MQASDFDLGEISKERNLVRLGRWSRMRKGYQGGWGRGLGLRLPCPSAHIGDGRPPQGPRPKSGPLAGVRCDTHHAKPARAL